MLKRVFLTLFTGLVCAFSAGVVFGQTFADKKTAFTETPEKFSPKLFKKRSGRSPGGAIDAKRKFEAGIFFTSLSRSGNGDRNGFGGRFTYDFASFGGGKYVAAWDSEVSFLPGDRFVFTPRSDGRVVQAFSGLKIGRRWEKFGIFAKARPGFVQYTRGKQDVTGTFANPVFTSERETNAAFDAGGILEFYPTKRITTRFDFGDTLVRFGQRGTHFYDFFNGTINPVALPSTLKHNFSFSAGIGFRF
jgi:hypothetical protein